MSKNKSKIIGTFGVHPTTVNGIGAYQTEKDGPITIEGVWKKENGKFIIRGTYESTFTDEENLPTI